MFFFISRVNGILLTLSTWYMVMLLMLLLIFLIFWSLFLDNFPALVCFWVLCRWWCVLLICLHTHCLLHLPSARLVQHQRKLTLSYDWVLFSDQVLNYSINDVDLLFLITGLSSIPSDVSTKRLKYNLFPVLLETVWRDPSDQWNGSII